MTITTNDRLIVLEEKVIRLESDLISSGVDKDQRITNMHSDMLDLKETVQNLTAEIREAVTSLKEIAKNTMVMSEVVGLYEKWKGFAWVMRSVGFWGALAVAFVAGIVASIVGFNT